MKKHLRQSTPDKAAAAQSTGQLRLVDLMPKWIERDGRRVGFTFLCPCCRKNWLTCFNEPTLFRDQVSLMHAAMGTTPEDDHDWPVNFVPAKKECAWTMSNLNDFGSLTVHPSIDASQSGNWHGWIKNGLIS